ncbi:hypothetical protein NP493_1650g00006 [Ridgeia piscesae]|uniref:Uncharacterized protein n=1 Tax=Ridgeia piscesae TaxID=27915 RepID=A0AAD9JWI8_RIDPI|nr:hypothetical protein NP493_1650g00006 [Ridgeia piscesae]
MRTGRGRRYKDAVTSAARKAYKGEVDSFTGVVALVLQRTRDLATGCVTTVVFLVPDTATVRKIIGGNAANMRARKLTIVNSLSAPITKTSIAIAASMIMAGGRRRIDLYAGVDTTIECAKINFKTTFKGPSVTDYPRKYYINDFKVGITGATFHYTVT